MTTAAQTHDEATAAPAVGTLLDRRVRHVPAAHEQNAADAAYPITRRSLERLRALVKEAHEIAASVRDSGPSAVHCEAYNLTAGVADVDRLVQDLAAALAMAEAV